MRIDNLTLKNFRNFENAEIPLNPKMNIVIGNNGSGKSSLLMGALTAASTFFLGIDYASPRSIKTEDVRHVAYETNKIYQQREYRHRRADSYYSPVSLGSFHSRCHSLFRHHFLKYLHLPCQLHRIHFVNFRPVSYTHLTLPTTSRV